MINIGRYRFGGPLNGKHLLKDAAGVYAVLDHRGSEMSVLDIGESRTVRSRVENHDRDSCWRYNARGRVCYAALYMPGSNPQQRRSIEAELRRQFAPACGVV